MRALACFSKASRVRPPAVFALFAFHGAILVGCGGRIESGPGSSECPSGSFCFKDTGVRFDSSEDTGTDTIEVDTGFEDSISPPDVIEPDVPFDVPAESGCGVGPCTFGEACGSECLTCTCTAAGSWDCKGCSCPATVPLADSRCGPGDGPSCSYPSGCGPLIKASCTLDGVWSVSDPCTGLCPGGLPIDGTTCKGATTCEYPTACGARAFASCDGLLWRVKKEPCPCPKAKPTGASCDTFPDLTTCDYPNDCGGTDTVQCNRGKWEDRASSCPVPMCPDVAPPAGSPCKTEGLGCLLRNTCGTRDDWICRGGVWVARTTRCTCPSTRPPDGTRCTGSLSCNYNNGCGNVASVFCDGRRYVSKDPGCAPGCPAAKPASGASCTAGSSCAYATNPSCFQSCFCDETGKFACLPETCGK